MSYYSCNIVENSPENKPRLFRGAIAASVAIPVGISLEDKYH
jgi:hypothetical protein